ncbi:MAG: carbon-nitrogen family hydrolase [Candidatus Margulisiibacteriota bacterium]|nr:MAG: carbon-nitrogen family hydrolase [Candidatus Margulisiibacteriota bacterium]
MAYLARHESYQNGDRRKVFTMSKIIVAQLQFPISYSDIRLNIDTALGLAEKALASRHVDFLVLPEMWSTGFISKNQIIANIESTSYILGKFSQLAQYYKSYIISGSLPRLREHNLFNTSFVINDSGTIIGQYSKINLFPLMDELKIFTPGENVYTFETQHCRIGLAICFDLRFPEMFRLMQREGAQLIFLPAQFPVPRLNHWLTLTKARAIENQLFFVATNCVGQCGGYDFFGQSVVIDPWGEIISNSEERTGFTLTAIDLKEVRIVREKIPCVIS